MELKQVGERTYYIEHETNIGVYVTGENRVCLIDTGSEGDGEAIEEILAEQGWIPDHIINTHTHIDHLGGNAYLMKKYGVPAYCTDIDMAFAHYEDLEASYMNGGRPMEKLRRIFRHPGKLGFRAVEDAALSGLTWRYLPGHTFGMIGVKTSDDIWFLGDAYLARDYLKVRRFGYLCDVDGYLGTLKELQRLDGRMFIPSHGIAEKGITEITDLNIANVESLLADVREICREYASLDQILQGMYDRLGLRTNIANHALLSSTMKCYLTYLQDQGEMTYKFIDRIMMWRAE